MDRIAKFVSRLSDIVHRKYVSISFNLENDRSQLDTETEIVERICSAIAKFGKTSFPPKETMNFKIPIGDKSGSVDLLLRRIEQSVLHI